jgi:hypothetical protein
MQPAMPTMAAGVENCLHVRPNARYSPSTIGENVRAAFYFLLI